jgi:hypothetical protein
MTDHEPYRWQDRVIEPRRAAFDLAAAVLVVILLVGGMAFSDDEHPPAVRVVEQAAVAAIVAEHTPPLPEVTKRVVYPRYTGGWWP